MAPRLPNALLYFASIFRPGSLRPDLRVKTIGHVDFPSLRKAGFNAVVVDKDNCVTLPEKDDVFPPFKEAWAELRAAFPPDKVLVVSNSAGTKKDPTGIAAEGVSHNLKVPVLIHSHPKPGCAPEIVSYFRGMLGRPVTRMEQQLKAIDQERQMQKEIIQKFLEDRDRDEWKKLEGLEVTELDSPHVRPTSVLDLGAGESAAVTASPGESLSPSSPDAVIPPAEPTDIRILVIGDRLFTDTLLAQRLRLLLPSTSPASPSILSIHTSVLPQPNDVRFLRWVEDKLSRGKVRDSPTDWSEFTKTPTNMALETLNEVLPIRTRWEHFKTEFRDSRMGWDPRLWTVRSVTFGLGKGLWASIKALWRGSVRLAKATWEGEQRVVLMLQERAAARKEAAVLMEKTHPEKPLISGTHAGTGVKQITAAKD